jgi:hypothetical protein
MDRTPIRAAVNEPIGRGQRRRPTPVRIEDRTFSFCPSLTNVIIPNSVRSIGSAVGDISEPVLSSQDAVNVRLSCSLRFAGAKASCSFRGACVFVTATILLSGAFWPLSLAVPPSSGRLRKRLAGITERAKRGNGGHLFRRLLSPFLSGNFVARDGVIPSAADQPSAAMRNSPQPKPCRGQSFGHRLPADGIPT